MLVCFGVAVMEAGQKIPESHLASEGEVVSLHVRVGGNGGNGAGESWGDTEERAVG